METRPLLCRPSIYQEGTAAGDRRGTATGPRGVAIVDLPPRELYLPVLCNCQAGYHPRSGDLVLDPLP
jgi:hypothetical protein